jgi:hypothetical protein
MYTDKAFWVLNPCPFVCLHGHNNLLRLYEFRFAFRRVSSLRPRGGSAESLLYEGT